jgi:hypothetical protein
MRLTNKQLEIVVDEIYNRVSKPIIEANNKALEEVILPEDDLYLKDVATYNSIQESIDKLEKIKDNLDEKWKGKTYNDYEFSSYSYNMFRSGQIDDYKKFIKKQSVVLADFPSRKDIEKQVILAGNKNIPELIETIIKSLQK